MRRSRIIVAMLAALILLAGLLLIPRHDEHLTMLTRDGRYDEASRLIAAMRAQGDARPELLMIDLNLYRKLGDVPRALEATRSYLAVRPDDPAVLEVHADLLLQMGLAREHLTASERLVRMRPDPERVARLLAQLSSAGLVEREEALLAHFAGSSVLRLEHYERLGALLSAKGDWQGAARWLRHVDRHAAADQSKARLKLLYVLLQSGQSAEARDRAGRWLGTWRDPYLSGQLILMLAQQSGEAAALPLALRLAETMPAAALDVAAVLTQAGQSAISRALLSRWIEGAGAPSPNDIRGYIYASLAAAEARRPLEKLLSLMRESADPEVIATFVEEIAHAYGPGTIGHLMPHLAMETLQRRPLLAADLAMASGNVQLTSWYLDKVDVTQLSEAQQDRWLELARHVGSASAVLERLLRLWERRGLPQRLIEEAAAQARTAGRPAIHDAIWASLHR